MVANTSMASFYSKQNFWLLFPLTTNYPNFQLSEESVTKVNTDLELHLLLPSPNLS